MTFLGILFSLCGGAGCQEGEGRGDCDGIGDGRGEWVCHGDREGCECTLAVSKLPSDPVPVWVEALLSSLEVWEAGGGQ